MLPGVIALLDALVAAGVSPGLATGNLRHGAKLKLGHYGLWERFVGGGFGDNSPVRADVVREGIEELAAATGQKPDARNAIVIGDTPLDVEAAHLAGAAAVAVATGGYTVDQLSASGAELVVPNLTDPAQVLGLVRNR